MKPLTQHISSKQVSILLTIVAIVLWSYSISRMQLVIDGYGIISSFPVTFFIGLAFLTIASAILWVSPRNEGKLLGLQTFLFLIMMFLTPLMLDPRVMAVPIDDYDQWWCTSYILQHGHLNPGAALYHSYPGLFIICATLVNVFGISSPDTLISVAPFIFLLALALPVYLFLRNTLSSERINYCWAGVWLFSIGGWVGSTHLYAFTLGYFLLLVILAVLSRSSFGQQGVETASQRLTLILLLASITITHLLGSIFAFGALIANSVTKRVKPYILILLAAVILLTWTFNGAISLTEMNLPGFVHAFFQIDKLWAAGVTDRFSYGIAAPERQIVLWIRIISSALLGAIALAGFIFGRWVEKHDNNDKIPLAITVFFVLIMFSMVAYGGEVLMRVLCYSLPLIAYFGVKLLYRKATASILCIFLLLLLPSYFISRYGNLYPTYESPLETTGFHFLFDHSNGGTLVAPARHEFEEWGAHEGYSYMYGWLDFHDVEQYGKIWGKDTIEIWWGERPGSYYTSYYIISQRGRRAYDYVSGDLSSYNQVEDTLNSAHNSNCVYVNLDIQFYNLIPP